MKPKSWRTPQRNKIVSDAAITATGWRDGLSTTITFVFTRPHPTVTPGTGPALKYGGRCVDSGRYDDGSGSDCIHCAGLPERGDREIETGGHRNCEAVIAVAQGIDLEEDLAVGK